MRKLVALFLFSSFFFSTGCATLAHGTTQDVFLKVTPSNATLTVDGKVTAPGMVTLTRGDSHKIVATLDGYNQAGRTIDGSIPTGWLVGYVLPSCLLYETPLIIPFIVDAINGAIDELPSVVELTLIKDDSVASVSSH